MSKIITLDQFKQLANKVKSEDDALGAQLETVAGKVEELVTTGGEANVLEGVKVNGQALAITDKMVNILIAAGSENGTISVNGAAVAVAGLQALAYKAKVSEADLDEALLASIASKATDADLDALTVRVTTAEGEIEEIKAAGYQTADQVQTIVQQAISESGHAHFEKVNAVPDTDSAEANTMYLVMNEETGHYDIYALIGENVELIDDTTVDLTAYSTTEQMNTAISEAVSALNIGDYAKASELIAAVARISALETKFADYYSKTEADEKFTDTTEASGIADQRIEAAKATDEEVEAAINEVWTPGVQG